MDEIERLKDEIKDLERAYELAFKAEWKYRNQRDELLGMLNLIISERWDHIAPHLGAAEELIAKIEAEL